MKITTLRNALTDAAADWNSVSQDLNDLVDYGVQVDFVSSDVTGSLKLQVRVDDDMEWLDLANSTQAVDCATATSYGWGSVSGSYKSFRVVWDYTAGTGTMHVKTILKIVASKIQQ